MMLRMLAGAALALLVIGPGGPVWARQSDIPEHFQPINSTFDYTKRDVMIPMRDGVKLHAVIITPKGAKDAPIMLDRTPYGASHNTSTAESPHGASIVPLAYGELFNAGYIIVFQDVRGKHGSEGDYINERPLRGPLNKTNTDHATDAYDTIDWLVKNTPESNGRVGMIGTSYDGMMVLMALTDPHPALKAAVPVNPVANTWMNDDDFHGGAFRLVGFDYYFSQDTERGEGSDLWRPGFDDYATFLKAGSAGDFMKAYGVDQLGFPKRMANHPAYDDFWKAQALEVILATKPLTVPTLLVASQWDQEDSYGAIAVYQALKPKDTAGDKVFLAFGPWRHGGAMRDHGSLGAINFSQDTALDFRTHVLRPFLDARLKTTPPKTAAVQPPVWAFQTGANVAVTYKSWPPAAEPGLRLDRKPLYLQSAGALGFDKPTSGDAGMDEYVSDPAKPVPYRLRPIRPTYSEGSTWGQWLVDDQRPFADRTDVLTYETPPLTEPVTIAGAPIANLYASTSGSDVDWVVKLIDVYPEDYAAEPKMGGYQLAVSMDILRGRYRKSFEKAEPVHPNHTELYRFALPNAHHTFLPGHRIMVQVQSSLFPLYDRNPQTFVSNIFFAQPGDYRKATERVFHKPGEASFVELPTLTAKRVEP